MKRVLFFVFIFCIFSQSIKAQITAPGAEETATTQYPEFSETDDIFIYCSGDSTVQDASLTASTALSGTKTFLWEKYSHAAADFELYYQESSEASTSVISGLANGCYRITVTQGSTSEIDRAWVFNNWIYAEAYITESNCEYFKLKSNFKNASFEYYDLNNNSVVTLNKTTNVEWLNDGDAVSSLANPKMYDPPTSNTYYKLRVYDNYGCEATSSVLYESVVTKADFSADPTSGEAPLEVTFSNNSENGTSGKYQWFFYYSLGDLAEASTNSSEGIDSIDFVAYDDAPSYTYQNTGDYMVKLVSMHVSDTLTCTDTAYLEDYIEVDSSYIVAPNVFTPNGDGSNDEFVIKFWSMKSLEVNIFNRWGRQVHHWKSGDIQGFEDTMEQSVWNGKINGKYASPGVYYFVVEGRGRDGIKRKEHGFVHLFRGKD